MVEFADALRGSQLESIDRFLQRRPEYLQIGKIAIAQVLIEKENASKLAPDIKAKRVYEHLWNQMSTEAPEDLAKNQLSIITFNYDRSLEYALFKAISSSYPDISRTQASEYLAGIPIIHVYGQLGRADFERPPGSKEVTRYRPYEMNDKVPALEACLHEIKLVRERQEDSDEFIRTRELLKRAERIAFLGFGYDEINMERLGKDQSLGLPSSATQIYGTALDLEENEKAKAEKLIDRYRPEASEGMIPTTHYPPVLENLDTLTLLRRYSVLD